MVDMPKIIGTRITESMVEIFNFCAVLYGGNYFAFVVDEEQARDD